MGPDGREGRGRRIPVDAPRVGAPRTWAPTRRSHHQRYEILPRYEILKVPVIVALVTGTVEQF
jgi:hypothetical protein